MKFWSICHNSQGQCDTRPSTAPKHKWWEIIVSFTKQCRELRRILVVTFQGTRIVVSSSLLRNNVWRHVLLHWFRATCQWENIFYNWQRVKVFWEVYWRPMTGISCADLFPVQINGEITQHQPPQLVHIKRFQFGQSFLFESKTILVEPILGSNRSSMIQSKLDEQNFRYQKLKRYQFWTRYYR